MADTKETYEKYVHDLTELSTEYDQAHADFETKKIVYIALTEYEKQHKDLGEAERDIVVRELYKINNEIMTILEKRKTAETKHNTLAAEFAKWVKEVYSKNK
jgi:predicted transcriptional regulator